MRSHAKQHLAVAARAEAGSVASRSASCAARSASPAAIRGSAATPGSSSRVVARLEARRALRRSAPPGASTCVKASDDGHRGVGRQAGLFEPRVEVQRRFSSAASPAIRCARRSSRNSSRRHRRERVAIEVAAQPRIEAVAPTVASIIRTNAAPLSYAIDVTPSSGLRPVRSMWRIWSPGLSLSDRQLAGELAAAQDFEHARALARRRAAP